MDLLWEGRCSAAGVSGLRLTWQPASCLAGKWEDRGWSQWCPSHLTKNGSCESCVHMHTHVWKARTQQWMPCACVRETVCVCVCHVLKQLFSIIELFCSKAYKLSRYQLATDQASDSPDGVYCMVASGSGAGNTTCTAPILISDTRCGISVWQVLGSVPVL